MIDFWTQPPMGLKSEGGSFTQGSETPGLIDGILSGFRDSLSAGKVLSSPVPCVRAEASFLNGTGALGERVKQRDLNPGYLGLVCGEPRVSRTSRPGSTEPSLNIV